MSHTLLSQLLRDTLRNVLQHKVELVQEEVPLGVPDVLICSVGTEIFFEKPGSDTEPQPDKKWIQLLDQGWNRQAALDAAAQFQELKPQVPFVDCIIAGDLVPVLKHKSCLLI